MEGPPGPHILEKIVETIIIVTVVAASFVLLLMIGSGILRVIANDLAGLQTYREHQERIIDSTKANEAPSGKIVDA